MALRPSTGLRNALAGTMGIKEVFEGGFIGIFTGGQPTSPDDAETGGKLVEISLAGGTAGITWGTAGDGGCPKSADTWAGTIGTAGIAGWFRVYDAPKLSGSNGTARRVDGNCGVSGSDLEMANTSLVKNATLTIDEFTLSFPIS